MKYNFSRNNKIFINKNLTCANESIAFCGRKLKRNSKIHSCFSRDGIVFIKKTEELKAFKVHHMNVLYDAFPEFDFFLMMMNQIKSNQVFISFYKFTLVLLVLHYIYMLKN